MTATATPATGTTDELLSAEPESPERDWRRLTALRAAATAGWYTYLGGDRRRGRYAIQLPDGRVRILHRHTTMTRRGANVRTDEAMAWIAGRAYGEGHPLKPTGRIPHILTEGEAGQLLGIGAETIARRVVDGLLHPLYGVNSRRHFIAAEVATLAGDQESAVEWRGLRRRLPAWTPLAPAVVETPSPDPLPIPAPPAPVKPTYLLDRCVQALEIADHHGWLRYLAATYDPPSGATIYTVELAHQRRGGAWERARIRVPDLSVLPFVQGVGDAHGDGDLVAYR